MAQKPLYIVATCGYGTMGALTLRMQVEEILKDENINARVDTADLSTALTLNVDILVSGTDVAPRLEKAKAKKIIGIRNFVSKQEIREKLLKAIKEIGSES